MIIGSGVTIGSGVKLIVESSALQLYLDAGNASSYPGSGTAWTDLSGNSRNGTLTNGPTYSSDNGGSIVFDGSNDFVQCTVSYSNGSNICNLDKTKRKSRSI
jgi:hypothetical protein